MKKIILSLAVSALLLSCEPKTNNISTGLVNNPVSANGINKSVNTPAIQFEKT